ncbi:MAG: nuclear transport factor 2 family protein [Bacteroidota bacterium]
MKAAIYLLFLVFALSPLAAQTSDYALVEETVGYYLDGGTNNDFATLEKAFHPDATMQYMSGDGFTKVNALEFFGSRMKAGPKSNRKTRVVHIDVSGHAATAKLEIDYPTFTFVDYMTLLKIEGRWQIVSKVFYRRVPQKE